MANDRRPSGTAPYWEPDTPIWWRYRRRGWQPGDPQEVRPVTVVADDDDGLVVWLAPGTPCFRAVLAENGRDIRTAGLERQFRVPRAQGLSTWSGNGILKIAPTGESWSVWLFRNDDWMVESWYVNLEDPHQRDDRNIYTRDHLLDLVVSDERKVTRKDEDELAEAVRAGLVTEHEAVRIFEVAADVEALIERWGPPFGNDWEHWRPDPSWPHPVLPDDVTARFTNLPE